MRRESTEGLAEDSGPDTTTHAAHKPVCFFNDGSYAFRTRKQIVYVDDSGRVHTQRLQVKDPADLMGRFGEKKAQAFALSDANVEPSPNFEHEHRDPAITPDDAVIEIEVDHLSVEMIVGKVAVEETRTTDLEKPVVVYGPREAAPENLQEIATEVAEFLGTAVRIYTGLDYPDNPDTVTAHAQKSEV